MASTGYGVPQGLAGTTEARKHPHTPVRDNKSTSNIIYIYNTAQARARNVVSPPDTLVWEATKAAYYMALGYYPTPCICGQMEALAEEGATPELIAAVLMYTAEHAPRPTWVYARAVIGRKLAEGITTAAAFDASVAAWYGQQQATRQQPTGHAARPSGRSTKTVIEQCYSQRDYDPAIIDGLSPAEIADAMRYDAAAQPAK